MDKFSTPKRDRTPSMEPPPIVRKKRRVCQGCKDDQPNQLAHYGGCIPNIDIGEDWSDCFQ
jgi:hypothetical protein